MLSDLVTCLAIGGAFVLVGFGIGRAYERQQPTATVVHLPRHQPHHHRQAQHAMAAHSSRQGHLRLVTPHFDYEQENEPA